MSRRLAIILTVLAVVVFGVVYFWPKDAGAGDVSGRLHLGDRGVQARGSIGGIHIGGSFGGVRWSDGLDRHRHDHGLGKHRHRDRDRRRHRARGLFDRPVVIIPSFQTERVIERETLVVPAPPPPAAPSAPVTEAPPPTPLDPQGQAQTIPARGAGQPREWVLGAVLPPDLPVVLLDPVAYGLPRPPGGQIYVRVDGDVLRIEADTRRIVSVLAG